MARVVVGLRERVALGMVWEGVSAEEGVGSAKSAEPGAQAASKKVNRASNLVRMVFIPIYTTVDY